jgi:membrane fusion protein, copper/silver efflux system
MSRFVTVLALMLLATACQEPAATDKHAGHTGHAAYKPAAPPLAELVVPAGARAALEEALTAYEQGRALLAGDSLAGMAEAMGFVVNALERASGAWPEAPPAVRVRLAAAKAAAQGLGREADAEAARDHFAALSEPLVDLAIADATLRQGWRLFSCPMTRGYDKWLQRPEEIENPYMGQRMLTCGSTAEWSLDVDPAEAHVHDPDEIAYYTCPMHPSVKQSGPGQCPLCGMDLTPVTKADAASGTVVVDESRRGKIGVKTSPVLRREASRSVRALGRVVYDERKVHDVTLRFGGFIETLYVAETGQEVRRGQVLFTLYSPELYAAQGEFLQALKTAERTASSSLAKAARKRLTLWGLTAAQVDQIAEAGEPMEALPILSPASGVVVEKEVVAGSKVMEGARVYRVAELSEVWVELDLYEGDVRLVKKGAPAIITLPYLPGERYEGEVSFLSPSLQEGTRVARVRVVLNNADGKLKPGMYANVALEVPLGERLWVPEGAVVYTGPRRVVFKDEGRGRLTPTNVEVGVKSEGYYEVLSGLKEGDLVVSAGSFLIASESRIKAGGEP